MRDALAIMITMTTYGTGLRDEERQWIDEDIILPAEPIRQQSGRQSIKYAPLTFSRDQLQYVGTLIGTSLRDRLGLRIWALTVQMWYVHLLVAATREPVARIVALTDDAVRGGLEWNRPIWGEGYEKRFCFDGESVRHRIAYVERNNIAAGLPSKPWPFLEPPDI